MEKKYFMGIDIGTNWMGLWPVYGAFGFAQSQNSKGSYQLQEDGSVYGDGITGSWEAEEGTCYMSITYDGTAYSGVFCQMNDEAGTQVMTFSAVGANESVWGVKY